MHSNRVILAAAGSRKTTFLVDNLLEFEDENCIITTYTTENLAQINSQVISRRGYKPPNLSVYGWFQFLLRECVRPYQNYFWDGPRISSIFFVEGQSSTFSGKTNVGRYYLFKDQIYTDKIAEFACQCNQKSGGKVIKRLEDIYTNIFIDEVQDLSGYDFDFLRLLFESKIAVTVVGDCRQSTYFTNCSPKNNKYKGKNIIDYFADLQKESLCTVIERNESYRCNQSICDFADRLYPNLSKTVSKNNILTGHDGVFRVRSDDLMNYVDKFSPQILRDKRTSNTCGLLAKNFGLSKGRTYDRVLIFPNGPMLRYLRDLDDSALKDKTRANFYVAVTRAKSSVAFVSDDAISYPTLRDFL